MTSNDVLVYVQIGEELIPIARGAYDAIREFFQNASENVDVDNGRLDQMHALYLERIADAKHEAGEG